MSLVVVGDALLDRDLTGTVDRLCPDAPVPVVDSPVDVPRPGGAGLAALLAAADGRDVVLVTALAPDAPGRELAGLLADAGVRVVDLGLDGQTPEKVRVRTDGRSLLRLDRGGSGGPVGALTPEAAEVLRKAEAVLVADYGRGVASAPGVREALTAVAAGRAPVVWDPHPRGQEPVPGVTLATPERRRGAALRTRPRRWAASRDDCPRPRAGEALGRDRRVGHAVGTRRAARQRRRRPVRPPGARRAVPRPVRRR